GNRARRRAVADERECLARGPGRRIHRLLCFRDTAGAGHAGRRGLSSRRSDPARIAADEAAALSFRPAVPRRHHLAEPRERRGDPRGWRLAASVAAPDCGGAPATLRPACPTTRPPYPPPPPHSAPRRARA